MSEKWKRLAVRLLFPHWAVKLFLVPVSIVLLIYSLGTKEANAVIAYISYGISAYTLVVISIKIPAFVKTVRRSAYANKYTGRYLTEEELRAKISLYIGVIINVLYAAFKFTAGIYYRSWWMGAIAVYYVILSVIRTGLMTKEWQRKKYEDTRAQREHELKSYRFCGYLMFVLNVAVAGLVIQMVWENQSYVYPGYLIYASAAYTFYCMVIAIINMGKARRLERPILAAAKMLSFACALTSMLALQTAMLTQFGSDDDSWTRSMNAMTGMAVCLLIFGMAVWMIRRANREIEKQENKNGNK